MNNSIILRGETGRIRFPFFFAMLRFSGRAMNKVVNQQAEVSYDSD
jgi:hypothetical protein